MSKPRRVHLRETFHIEQDLVERRREITMGGRESDKGVVAGLHLKDDPALVVQVDADVDVRDIIYGRREVSI